MLADVKKCIRIIAFSGRIFVSVLIFYALGDFKVYASCMIVDQYYLCSSNIVIDCACGPDNPYGNGPYCVQWEYFGPDPSYCRSPDAPNKIRVTDYSCPPGESACGGGSCFLPGTQVSTPQGEKPIETIKPGDEVYSFDELTGKKLLNVVQNSPVRTVPQYYIIKTESGREVKVTAEHPFLTKSKEDQSEDGVLGGLGRLGELVRFIKSKIYGVVRASDWL